MRIGADRSTPTQVDHVFVADVCRNQRPVQRVLIEIRNTSRTGEVPHVDEDLDPVLAQEVNELLDRSSRVPDSPDGGRANGHGKGTPFPASLTPTWKSRPSQRPSVVQKNVKRTGARCSIDTRMSAYPWPVPMGA